jgi:FKBP-type peptidyl-prolyl cis-trans isomerase FkpA
MGQAAVYGKVFAIDNMPCYTVSDGTIKAKKGRFMRRLVIALIITLTAAPSFAADTLKTEEQKTLYAVGQIMAQQLAVFNLTPGEFETVLQGLTDAMGGKPPQVETAAYTKQVRELAITRRKAEGEKLAALTKEFMDKAEHEKGAVKSVSGLIYKELKEGSGASPKASDRVKVNYRGTFVDGKEFDSSYRHGKPAELSLSGVIKCWTEGMQKMKPGGKAQLVCPPKIAYGTAGSGSIPPNATLVFEVELLDVINPPIAQPAPKPVPKPSPQPAAKPAN